MQILIACGALIKNCGFSDSDWHPYFKIEVSRFWLINIPSRGPCFNDFDLDTYYHVTLIIYVKIKIIGVESPVQYIYTEQGTLLRWFWSWHILSRLRDNMCQGQNHWNKVPCSVYLSTKIYLPRFWNTDANQNLRNHNFLLMHHTQLKFALYKSWVVSLISFTSRSAKKLLTKSFLLKKRNF